MIHYNGPDRETRLRETAHDTLVWTIMREVLAKVEIAIRFHRSSQSFKLLPMWLDTEDDENANRPFTQNVFR